MDFFEEVIRMKINDEGIRECTFAEIEANNKKMKEENRLNEVVDMSSVNVCRKIRNIARTQNITVRDDAHSNDNARNLISYLEYCNIDLNDYVKDYLYNLQPFMIERNQNEEYDDNVIAITDKLYNISLYIKIEKDNNGKDSTVISFHEDYKYKNGVPIARQNSLIRRNDNEVYVPVFKDSYRSINQTNNTAFIDVYAIRGLLPLKLTVPTEMKCKDVYFVRKSDIEDNFLNYCNTYIQDLYSSNLDLDYSKIELFTMLQQVSFTSYGKDSFSSISLLIDSLLKQNDIYSKKASDCALVTYVKNLKLNEEDCNSLITLLEEKYKITNAKIMPALISRIKLYLMESSEPQAVKMIPKSENRDNTEQNKDKNTGISHTDD